MGKLFKKKQAGGTINVMHRWGRNKCTEVLSVEKDGDYTPCVNIDEKYSVVSVKDKFGTYDVYTFPKNSAGLCKTLLSRMLSSVCGYFVTKERLMIFWKKSDNDLFEVYMVSLFDYQQVLRTENENYLYNVAAVKLCSQVEEPQIDTKNLGVSSDYYCDNLKVQVNSDVFFVRHMKHRLNPWVSTFKLTRDTDWSKRLSVVPVKDVKCISKMYIALETDKCTNLIIFGIEGKESVILENLSSVMPHSIDNVSCGAFVCDDSGENYWINSSYYYDKADVVEHNILPFYTLQRVEDYLGGEHAAFISRDKDGMAIGIRVVNIKDDYYGIGEVLYDVIFESPCKVVSLCSGMCISYGNGDIRYEDTWNVDGKTLTCELHV